MFVQHSFHFRHVTWICRICSPQLNAAEINMFSSSSILFHSLFVCHFDRLKECGKWSESSCLLICTSSSKNDESVTLGEVQLLLQCTATSLTLSATKTARREREMRIRWPMKRVWRRLYLHFCIEYRLIRLHALNSKKQTSQAHNSLAAEFRSPVLPS